MENKLNKIKNVGKSDFVMMGPLRLRQPIPAKKIKEVDPVILLHHYGPYEIGPEKNPMDLGPHPHRGFEPVTFLIQGEQLHRDSLGNESVVKAGDVQWTTSGRGIIHAEAPTKEFVAKGGTLEGIQLWINLPKEKKMIQPNYQHVKKDDFKVVVSEDGNITTRVIAGSLHGYDGMIQTQTSLDAYMMDLKKGGSMSFPLKEEHQAMIYLIDGNVRVDQNENLKINENQIIIFQEGSSEFHISAKEKSKILFLSGAPIRENIVSYGPYVMNTQTEILEAMRDFQMGKMGFLTPN